MSGQSAELLLLGHLSERPELVPDSAAYRIREGRREDFAFVYPTWLRSLRALYPRQLDAQLFTQFQHHLITRILSHATVYIACPPEDDSTILGYAVCDKSILHFVYVKQVFRRLGIAYALLSHWEYSGQPAFYSCYTAMGERLTKKFQLKFNPYLV